MICSVNVEGLFSSMGIRDFSLIQKLKLDLEFM